MRLGQGDAGSEHVVAILRVRGDGPGRNREAYRPADIARHRGSRGQVQGRHPAMTLHVHWRTPAGALCDSSRTDSKKLNAPIVVESIHARRIVCEACAEGRRRRVTAYSAG